ncbi:MAG: SPOR domain-containing protein [Magnetococcales bacterium]|nr:SPOR domain-containing protein [Magnetococcales bacterium]
MARTSFMKSRLVPLMVIGLLVILNILVQGMGFMGMGFKTPEEAIWPGPVMPGKLLALPDSASARVVGQANAVVEKPKGVVPVVKVEPAPVAPAPVVAPPPAAPPPAPPAAVTEGRFVVQVGSYVLNLGVDSLVDQLKTAGLNPRLETVQERVPLNNVQAGPYEQLEMAKEVEAKLKAGGYHVQVEESWEGFILSLNKSVLLSHAVEEMEQVRRLGVTPLRLVKVVTDLAVRKILLGPFDTKEKAMKMSARVAEMGIAVPVLKTWPLTNSLP